MSFRQSATRSLGNCPVCPVMSSAYIQLISTQEASWKALATWPGARGPHLLRRALGKLGSEGTTKSPPSAAPLARGLMCHPRTSPGNPVARLPAGCRVEAEMENVEEETQAFLHPPPLSPGKCGGWPVTGGTQPSSQEPPLLFQGCASFKPNSLRWKKSSQPGKAGPSLWASWGGAGRGGTL